MPTLRGVATSAVVVAGAPQVDQDTDAIRTDDTAQKAAETGYRGRTVSCRTSINSHPE